MNYFHNFIVFDLIKPGIELELTVSVEIALSTVRM